MTEEQYLRNLNAPNGKIDVILDTDAYNEVDDQCAISLLIKSTDKFNVQAITATPFFNLRSESPSDGMEKRYNEIIKIVQIADRQDLVSKVYRGSDRYLDDEKSYVQSEAADIIIETAKKHSPDNPLYLIGIAAITNIASALLKDPQISENVVVVWLGGNPFYYPNNDEFNLKQDIAAARVVFDSKCPLIQFPCWGVTEVCRTTVVD